MSVQAKHMDWHLHFFSQLPVPHLQPPNFGLIESGQLLFRYAQTKLLDRIQHQS